MCPNGSPLGERCYEDDVEDCSEDFFMNFALLNIAKPASKSPFREI